MEFSPQQSSAIDAVGEWLADPRSETEPFYLAGYAGTGKTTLAKHLAEQQDGQVLFGAYTGKAASVLRRKGCPASTIHSMIYELEKPDEALLRDLKKAWQAAPEGAERDRKKQEFISANKPSFRLREDSLLTSAALVVIDEVSMVGEEMGKDLMSFGVPILVLGDPGQLPPVSGTGFFTAREPSFLLTEIHRQALGSPVISMATKVRQGGRLAFGHYGDSRVFGRHETEASAEQAFLAEQIICGRNTVRKNLNNKIRDRRGFAPGLPVADDKLICLRNNPKLGLLNGTQWEADAVKDCGAYLDLHLWPLDALEEPKDPLILSAHHFDADLNGMTWRERKELEEFDYGYAITCHKSQGSQWPSVWIQDESWIFKDDRSRWLYTAITRAESTVFIQL